MGQKLEYDKRWALKDIDYYLLLAQLIVRAKWTLIYDNKSLKSIEG